MGLNVTAPGPLGEKTSVSAARVLREAILSGQLPPGYALGEQSLGRQLGISRTPVREALLVLRGEGLIDMPPNRPAIVRGFTAEDLLEMHSVRALLEGYAARIAATRLTASDIDTLHESCFRYERLGRQDENLPKLVEENFRFHDTIARAAASERINGMIRQVTALPLIYKSYMTYSSENRATALEHHHGILAALEARDEDAAELAMKSHVLWARDVALAHLPQLEAAAAAEADADA